MEYSIYQMAEKENGRFSYEYDIVNFAGTDYNRDGRMGDAYGIMCDRGRGYDLFVWHGAFHVECSACGKGCVVDASCDDCGSCAVCKYYAFWDVPELGESCGGFGNCGGSWGVDAYALYASSGRAMGSWSPRSADWGKACAEPSVQINLFLRGNDTVYKSRLPECAALKFCK